MRDRVEPFVVPGEDARPEFVTGVRWDLAVVVAGDGAEEHVVGAFGFGEGSAVAIAPGCRIGARRGCKYTVCGARI